MSFNDLSGKLPAELGQLQNLNTLILKNNSLGGTIPKKLMSCLSLVNLDISYNNFSGDIPSTTTFSKFPPESFMGNPFLCGNWLGSLCRPYERGPKAIFSRTVVVFITLGFITLLSMGIVAIYRSNQPNQFTKGLNKADRGMCSLVVF